MPAAQTLHHVPSAPLGVWRSLGAETLDWVHREPQRQSACLWFLLVRSLLLHSPVLSAASSGYSPPLSQAVRVVAILGGDFDTCMAERNASVWRPCIARRAGARHSTAPRDARRAVRLAPSGRLTAAARALRAYAPPPQTPAVERKARGLLPPSTPDVAPPALIEASFSAELARAAEHSRWSAVPAATSRDTSVLAIRTAPHGSSPGPLGTRMEHLWALG